MDTNKSPLFAPDTVHCVIDLETLGTKPGAIILQIGAAAFYLNDSEVLPPRFEARIDVYDSRSYCFTEDPDTVKWWEEQTPALFNYACAGIESVVDTLSRLEVYLNELTATDNLYIWGNGANFDPVLLESYYTKIGEKVPWNFRNIMCFRTLKTLHRDLYAQAKQQFTNSLPHDALSDAVYEAQILRYILKEQAKWPT